jgi:hypothetical protein
MLLMEYHWAVKWFWFNAIIGILLIEWALSKHCKLEVKTEKDKEMADKYRAFARNDIHLVKRIYLYPFAPFVLFRLIAPWSVTGACWIVV